MLDLMSIVSDDYTYQRNKNHMAERLEARLAAMYGAHRVVITSSGMSAITAAFDYICPSGGKVLINSNTYYETRQWISLTGRFEVQEVDMADIAEVEKHISGIKIVYLDNPDIFGRFYDLAALSDIARAAGAKVIVDNSVLSVYYANPIQDGADIAVESYTKYVAGHGDVLAGGIIFADRPDEMLDAWMGRRGNVVNPLTVYLVERGLETLDVRMQRHTMSANKIFESLKRSGVKVWYAGKGGCLILPGMTKEFCAKLKCFKVLPTFGTTYSTASYVRSADLYNSIGDYVRLSVGLEDPQMLLEDLRLALDCGI